MNPGTKRGNPDFVSSSFYVPKKINIKFDQAILSLKANGFEVDRSDILSVCMERFGVAVAAAEAKDEGEGLNLEEILGEVTDLSVTATAGVSYLKQQLHLQSEKMEGLAEELRQSHDQSNAASSELNQSAANLVESMLKYVPFEERAPYESVLKLMREGESSGLEG